MIVVSCMVQTIKENADSIAESASTGIFIHGDVIAFLKEPAIRVSFISRHIQESKSKTRQRFIPCFFNMYYPGRQK